MDAHAYSFSYELEKLERIISKDMAAFIHLRHKLDPELVGGFKDAIKEETEHIKSQLVHVAFTLREDQYIEKYIQFHQRSLIRLAGQLLQYARPADIHTVSDTLDHTVLSQFVYRSLEDLLDFTEKHFNKYFDRNAWIPAGFRAIVFHNIGDNIELIEAGLRSLAVDDDLIRIALDPLKQLAGEGSSNEATYRKVVYLRELKKELLRTIANNHVSRSSKEIRSTLFYLNFNTRAYFNYCVNYIEKVIGGTETIGERIERLAYFFKLVVQGQAKPGFVFDLSQPPLKEGLSGWILQEIKYNERRQRALQASSGQTPAMNSANFKVKVDLSVSQFAHLVKVLTDLKIIQNTNVSQLLRFLSNNFQTDRTDTISYDSLRIKYYDAERNARIAVRDMLQRMINNIEAK